MAVRRRIFKGGMTINVKISLMLTIVMLIATIIVGIAVFYVYYTDSIKYKEQFALGVAQSVAVFIDGDKYQELDLAGERTEYYYEIQPLFEKAQRDSGITYLYAIVDNGDGIYYRYLFDAEGEDFFGNLDLIEGYGADTVFETGEPVFDIFNEQYGKMIAALVPIRNSRQEIVGVIGADIMLSDVYNDIRWFILRGAGVLIIFNIGFIFAARAVLKRIFINPIIKLTSNADSIANGKFDNIEFDDFGDINSKDELGVLNNALKRMLAELNQNHELKLIAVKAQFEKEKAEASEAARNLYFANMSHEIRTPMNAILGMSELLLNENLGETQYRYVRDIRQSSEALLRIINIILDISKIDAGSMELIDVHYNFPIFLDNINSIGRFLAEQKGLKFIFEKSENIPNCLYGDELRLRQIILNILGNAIKFTKNGSVKLKVSSDNENLNFEIKDTGIGIKQEDMSGLFEVFSQFDSKKNRNVAGSGLGLAISKRFAELMGGNITYSSVYGEGTTFNIIIPLIEGNENEIEDQPEIVEIFSAPEANIMVVDDNAVNLNVAKGLLKLFNIDCDTAESGGEALEKIAAKDYDIIFMDHMMPEMDGTEALSKIRGMGDKYKNLIVIALTANAVSDTKEMLLSLGMNDFISKPVDKKTLGNTLRKWLPARKIINGSLTVKTVSEQASFLNEAEKISGLNTKLGLERSAMQKDVYERSLNILANKIPAFSDEIMKALEDKDIKNLAIKLHGMKSALGNIGAEALSKQAQNLESIAIKEGSGLHNGIKEFLKELTVLGQDLQGLFPVTTPKSQGSDEIYTNGIKELTAALEDYDYQAAIKILDRLLMFNFDNENNNKLISIKSYLANYDYDGALALCR